MALWTENYDFLSSVLSILFVYWDRSQVVNCVKKIYKKVKTKNNERIIEKFF
jgi:hypothetical protein